MSDRSGNGDYEVGYRKPPKHSRFRKGQSGNPKGRPKARKSADDIVREELFRAVTVTENGQQVKLPKLQLALRQMMNKAAKGDRPCFESIKSIWVMLSANSAEDEGDGDEGNGPGEDSDDAILQYFVKAIRNGELRLDDTASGDGEEAA